MATDLTVANTILSQLGGAGRLTAMIGAHSFSGEKDRLRFKFKARAPGHQVHQHRAGAE